MGSQTIEEKIISSKTGESVVRYGEDSTKIVSGKGVDVKSHKSGIGNYSKDKIVDKH